MKHWKTIFWFLKKFTFWKISFASKIGSLISLPESVVNEAEPLPYFNFSRSNEIGFFKKSCNISISELILTHLSNMVQVLMRIYQALLLWQCDSLFYFSRKSFSRFESTRPFSKSSLSTFVRPFEVNVR